jgi:carbohydrate-binding DOMON domain-containing protein
MAENPLLSILTLVALALLVAVTGGVGYLTVAGWRDRRLLEEEKRESRRTTPTKTTTKTTPAKTTTKTTTKTTPTKKRK